MVTGILPELWNVHIAFYGFSELVLGRLLSPTWLLGWLGVI